MYPKEMPRRAWYAIARGSELTPGSLTQRWIHGLPVALFRRLDGQIHALIDQCVHRQLPLTMGQVEGDTIRCGYHGLRFDGAGQCVEVPGQPQVPARLRVRSFPIAERSPFVWIWTGDPEEADQGLIPAYPWTSDSGWTWAEGTKHLAARAQLLNENLLDLSHLEFLHPGSIGTAGIAAAPITVEHEEGIVRVIRTMEDSPAAPFYTKTMGVTGTIDRFQTAEFFAPGFHITHLTVRQEDQQWTHKVLHCVTPESTSSTHYFWAIVRDYHTSDAAVTELQRAGIDRVFGQDAEACAAIERVLQAYEPESPFEHNIKVDGGPLRARRMIEALIDAERVASSANTP